MRDVCRLLVDVALLLSSLSSATVGLQGDKTFVESESCDPRAAQAETARTVHGDSWHHHHSSLQPHPRGLVALEYLPLS